MLYIFYTDHSLLLVLIQSPFVHMYSSQSKGESMWSYSFIFIAADGTFPQKTWHLHGIYFLFRTIPWLRLYLYINSRVTWTYPSKKRPLVALPQLARQERTLPQIAQGVTYFPDRSHNHCPYPGNLTTTFDPETTTTTPRTTCVYCLLGMGRI